MTHGQKRRAGGAAMMEMALTRGRERGISGGGSDDGDDSDLSKIAGGASDDDVMIPEYHPIYTPVHVH